MTFVMGNRPNLKDHSIEALRERFARDGFEPYRAEQIASWLYRRGVDDPDSMTDLGRTLRAHLAAAWETRALEVETVQCSSDGTLKAVLRARDGVRLESVLIPEERRTTLCVSTQVGCPLACCFCATGALGFTRNLATAEIVDQVCRMRGVSEHRIKELLTGLELDAMSCSSSKPASYASCSPPRPTC